VNITKEIEMPFNLHIPTSFDEIKELANAATQKATDIAAKVEEVAADAATAAKDKAANVAQTVVDKLPTVTINKPGSNTK
jgi:hypothetical protein